MQTTKLKFGKSEFEITFDSSRFSILKPEGSSRTLPGSKIQEALSCPISCEPLETLATGKKSALIVVSDATRNARTDILAPLLIERLVKAGVKESNISILFARGNHREVTREEIRAILGTRISCSITIVQHDSTNKNQLECRGQTSRGTEIKLNKLLFEQELVLTISAISSHYFAGFGGGRKSIFPGLGARQAIIRNHLLAIDFENGKMAPGVGPGRLAGNRVHEDFLEIVNCRPPDFAVNVILTQKGEIGSLYAGDWLASHQEACREFMNLFGAKFQEKRDAVITSCGGYPKDVDLIQSLKTIQYASLALKPGGKLLVYAEAIDGTGSPGFEDYFPISSVPDFLNLLKKGNLKNGQTALAIHQKTKEFNIGMVTNLPAEILENMGITTFEESAAAQEWIMRNDSDRGYIIPLGAVTLPREI